MRLSFINPFTELSCGFFIVKNFYKRSGIQVICCLDDDYILQ